MVEGGHNTQEKMSNGEARGGAQWAEQGSAFGGPSSGTEMGAETGATDEHFLRHRNGESKHCCLSPMTAMKKEAANQEHHAFAG